MKASFLLICVAMVLPLGMSAWVGSSSEKVMEIFSAGSQLYVGGDFLSQNSKYLGQQVAILNAISLAKSGKSEEAQKEVDLMAVTISLYDVPNTFRQGVSLVRGMFLEDPGALPKTINAGKKHVKLVSSQIDAAVKEFSDSYPNPTSQNLVDMRKKINDILANDLVSQQSRQSVLTALDQDFKRMEVLSADTTNKFRQSRFRKIKTWFEKLKMNKAKKFLGNRVGDIGVLDPIVDIIGAALSINGLVIASKNGDTKSIVINSVALVASVVGVITWFLAAGGVAWAGPLNMAVGLIAAVVTVFINIFWPSNPVIDIANEFSKQAIQDLTANMVALDDPTYSKSFGWVYQANTGVFLIGRNIRPSDPVTFFQPACTNATEGSTPCDHNTKTFHGNKYLVVGTERESADGSFTLDVTSDFIGRPKTEMFCGNTICLNAVSFYETLSQSGTGVTLRQVRSLRIDTTTIPDYSKVDLASFEPSSRDVLANSTKSHSKKLFRKTAKKSHCKQNHGKKKSKNRRDCRAKKRSNTEEVAASAACNPKNDRIEIDELRRFEPGSDKKVHIRTGDGDDILSIGGLIDEPDDSRTNILDANLGEGENEENVFSIGYLLDTQRSRSDLIAGVKFDNTAGEGHVCYLKRDLVHWKCVGKVKGVDIFKGSKLHDTVTIGGHGPKQVIQHHGANEYQFKIDDLKTVLEGRDPGSDMCPQQGKWPWAYHKLGDQDFCYMIIDKLVSDWDKAQAMCNEQGAGLVTIHSEEENAFVRRHIETSGQGRWLGLTTNYKEGGYHWMDGSRMEDPPFLNIKKNTNSPITSTYDYCIEMEESGLWRYIRCSSARSFTCKKPSPSTGCSGGWSSHNVHERSFCYKSFGRTDENQRKSFYSAARHCKSQDGSLTSILNEEEQMFLLGLNGNEQWIGLDDGWGARVFLWSDGQQLVSGDERWADNEPNNNNYQEHCVLLEGTTWKDWDCEEEKVFTCEKMPQGGQCPNSWQLQDNSCLLGGDTAMTWSQGEQYCMEQSATLVKADSESKINAINSIHDSEASWIGLRDDKYNLEYKWFDGSEFDYSNWDSEKPTRYSRKHCAIMTDNGEGKWIPYYCKDDLWRNPFCKKKATARMNFQITDLSKDGLPRVKVFIPDSMPQATVQYDEEAMVVHVKDPSLGWVARIEVVRDTPYAPQVIQVKNNRETRLGHTELE